MKLKKKIAFHWSENFEYYRYHDNIILRNLNKRSTDLNILINNGLVEIKGFSWELKCISDNYFFGEKEYSTIFLEDKFKEEIVMKREFLKAIYEFNMLNFGNSFGRSAFRTFASDSVQDYLSIRM